MKTESWPNQMSPYLQDQSHNYFKRLFLWNLLQYKEKWTHFTKEKVWGLTQ